MPTLAAATQKRTKNSASDQASTNRRAEDEESRPYVIVSDIGKGSFATVYKGYHEVTHQQVAIKTVRRDILTAKLFDNLQSEIEILKSLSHRHITRLMDIIRADRNIYLIMEFCSGGDLTNYIKKRGRVEGLEYKPADGGALQYYPHPKAGGLDEIVVRSFLRQLARALKFLRHRDLIHRDIKPQNLLLNPASPEELAKGHPLGVPILKVADFGFARSLPNQMMAETLCGSPLYMAPEILRYEKYDAKADLWSVGAVLYEMSVGKAPFRAQNHIELLKKIEQTKTVKFPDEDPQRANAEENAVPADVKKLIRSLLKRNPAERWDYGDFFGSTALAKSKFPRPARNGESPTTSLAVQMPGEGPESGEPVLDGRPLVPEHHHVIPPEVLDPTAMIPPSKFHFRKREGSVSGDGQTAEGVTNSPRSPALELHNKIPDPPDTKRGLLFAQQVSPKRKLPRPLSTEGSIIPGETEEDGLLRREYVLVGDTRAVEFNQAVDEISAARPMPLKEHPAVIPPSPVDERKDYSVPNTPHTSFPPTPNANIPLSSSPSSIASRAASNALNRALSLASKKLFGTPSPRPAVGARIYSASSSPKRQQIIAGPTSANPGDGDGGAERDPLEDELLGSLEQLAQKTDVLTHWADEMYEYVKAIPQKPLPDPNKFVKKEGEGEKHANRRKNADIEAEYNAVTCVAVYMLLMSFSQRGIDKLRNHQEHMKMRHPDGNFVVSEGFDDALKWFKDHFIKCNDRAALVKTWLPAQFEGPKSWLDQLVYDRALTLSRMAARKELLDQATSPDECAKLYEESLWCLYALQDDLLQTGNPFMEEDQATITTWIKRTKLRLVRCQARMNMNDRDRLNDARADQNLVDARYPPPWEVASPSGATAASPNAEIKSTPTRS